MSISGGTDDGSSLDTHANIQSGEEGSATVNPWLAFSHFASACQQGEPSGDLSVRLFARTQTLPYMTYLHSLGHRWTGAA